MAQRCVVYSRLVDDTIDIGKLEGAHQRLEELWLPV
jgi:hypothetical protein